MQRPSFQHAQQRLDQQRQDYADRRKRLQGQEARYTMILHSARNQLDLSITEYCLADTIHKLSSTHSPVPGWCYASKQHLADNLGLTRRTVHNMLNTLKGKKIVEVEPTTGYLRTTQHWHDTVEILKTKIFA